MGILVLRVIFIRKQVLDVIYCNLVPEMFGLKYIPASRRIIFVSILNMQFFLVTLSPSQISTNLFLLAGVYLIKPYIKYFWL